jgi:predicted NAD/FAD-dependent oxidoreductase
MATKLHHNNERRRRIAIVGAGITGSVIASYISEHYSQGAVVSEDKGRDVVVEIHIFDQGRRGPGGRSSHRTVQLKTNDKDDIDKNTTSAIILDDDHDDGDENDTVESTAMIPVLHFDHGCQFFRADSVEMKHELLLHWLRKGWVKPWKARFGTFPITATTCTVDFFGMPPTKENKEYKNDEVYIGVGGMNQLPRNIICDCCCSDAGDDRSGVAVTFHKGTRVINVQSNPTNRTWDLFTVTGDAAYHDTKEQTSPTEETVLGSDFNIIIFTDISSAFESWHKASAGIPHSFRQKVPHQRPRIPLFSCMVAFDEPIGDKIPFDAFTVSDSISILWFAARSDLKPGFPRHSTECWTLISTPSYAVQQIQETTMRDPTTGSFRPQENEYLNSVPGPELLEAFIDLVRPYVPEIPSVIYLQAQRWGSGLPAPKGIKSSAVEEICGTTYVKSLHSSLVYQTKDDDKDGERKDFVADDELGLYYAGDFCSKRNPGFEAAALSGLDCAKHIVRILHNQEK